MESENIDDINKMISELENLLANMPTDDAGINDALKRIDEIATEQEYTFSDPEITNYETLVTKLESAKTAPVTLSSYFNPDIAETIAISGGDLNYIKTKLTDEFNNYVNGLFKKVEYDINNLKYAYTASATSSQHTKTLNYLQNINQIRFVFNELTNIITDLEKTKAIKDELDKIMPNQIGKVDIRTLGEKTTILFADIYKYTDQSKDVTWKDFETLLTNTEDLLDAYQHYKSSGYRLKKPSGEVFDLRDSDKFGKIKKSLTDFVSNLIILVKKVLTDDYDKIKQKGGDPKLMALLLAKKKLVEEKAKKLLEELKKKKDEIESGIERDTDQTTNTSGTTPYTRGQKTDKITLPSIDYVQPLISLIAYKFGSINEYDRELINYCTRMGLEQNTVFAIVVAQNKHDLNAILSSSGYVNYQVLVNIMRLKKLSAEKKFREDYKINSDEQLAILLEKKYIWGN